MFREDIIIPLVKDKHVLDCGGIDHWAMQMKQEQGNWLHAIIANHAKSVVGVDILESQVRKIQQQGAYKFIVGNVEHLPFQSEFDVIVAGEIVEHIYNMGLFLDSCWRSLKPGGTLIITTPGHHSVSTVIASAFLGKERCHPEHTCYYSQQTLSYIVQKHGFEICSVHRLSRPAQSRVMEQVRNWVIGLRPSLAEQIVLVAGKLPQQAKYEDKW